MTRLLALFAAFLLLLAPWAARAQGLAPGERAMAVELVAEDPMPAPGETVTLALAMSPKPGWHGYWENPGDAGMPNRMEWRLPEGVGAGPLRYPVPERLTIAGLMNYVYEGDHALLVDVTIPAGVAPGTVLPLRGRLDYLVCTDEICVPEAADVAVDLRVSAAAEPPERRAQFDAWREALPRPLGVRASFARSGDTLRLAVPIPAAMALSEPYLFPITDGAIDYAAPQRATRSGDMLVIETRAAGDAGAIEGVLAIGGHQGLSLTAAPGAVPAGGTALAGGAAEAGSAAAILLALAGALLGGLLLNVMPCVFPILSLKALSLARAGGEEREARREALAYTAGVVLVCVALGGALLALRAGGAAAGWAFQLQDPRVILFLLLLVTAIGLNLAGLFELPSLGGGRSEQGGARGAFATGALAAFVATPCTGPFMGAALGAALILPPAAALAIFAGLGLGLALPFLLLGFIPALRRRMPKPGPWMARFRRILAVPMFLTALALAWVLERQSGWGGIALAFGAALVVGAALWWAGRRHGWLPLAPAAAAVGASVLLLPTAVTPAAAEAGVLGAQPFSEKRLQDLRAEGKPVFVYFTADWCVTCKVNEQAVLERDAVAEAFETRGVEVLVGDWTRGDAEIGRFLEKHGRSGVPLYLWYAPGEDAETLPQILTTGTVTALGA